MASWGLYTTTAITLLFVFECYAALVVDPNSTLDCHRRVYSYKVSKTDSQGRQCWDTINVMSCWGRCDSNEISDWRFPFKRSFHPVCLHDSRELTAVTLTNCEEGVEPGTERYEFLQAVSCRCLVCKSSEASCEGLRPAPYQTRTLNIERSYGSRTSQSTSYGQTPVGSSQEQYSGLRKLLNVKVNKNRDIYL